MNINRIKIQTAVGLDDAELMSYYYSIRENATIFEIELWNGQKAKMTFKDPIHFTDRGTRDVTNFYEFLSVSNILEEALDNLYVVIPDKHPYKVYQFLDTEDEPSIEIVCKSFDISID